MGNERRQAQRATRSSIVVRLLAAFVIVSLLPELLAGESAFDTVVTPTSTTPG